MGEVGTALEKARAQVWDGDGKGKVAVPAGDGQGVGEGLGRPSGADGVFWDSQQEVGERVQKPPEVVVWKAGEVFV